MTTDAGTRFRDNGNALSWSVAGGIKAYPGKGNALVATRIALSGNVLPESFDIDYDL